MLDSSIINNVANVIHKQLMSDIIRVWAWGSKDFTAIERFVQDEYRPALVFSIRTPKIKRGGKVIISLNEGSDTYIVEALRIHGADVDIVGMKTDVFADQLYDVIDDLIEDEETYNLTTF